MLDVALALLFYGLCLFPVTAYFNQLLFYAISIYIASRKLYTTEKGAPTNYPGVTILKPLMGVSPQIHDGLVSHFELQYPNFEIVFCIESPDDPAIDMVHKLCQKYPHVDSRVIIGGHGNIVNPVVNNIFYGYESAKYDLIWISCSRIKVNTDIMLDLVRKSENADVGIVHQLPHNTDERGFWNSVEKISFGSSLGKSCIALNYMGMICLTGMSYIVKKRVLDKFGGLACVKDFLAEDFFLAQHMSNNAYKVVLSNFPTMQCVGDCSFTSYKCRMVRWLRLRFNMVTFVAFFFEPMVECLNLGILISLALHYLFFLDPRLVFLIHVCLCITLDYTLLRFVNNGPLNISFFTFLCAWWTRELMNYVIFVNALAYPQTITWGPRTYSLSLGGITKIKSSHSSDSVVTPASRPPNEPDKPTTLGDRKITSVAVCPVLANKALVYDV